MACVQGLTGRIVRMELSGFGVVCMDNGKEAFFDRFAPLASQGGRHLKPGMRILAGTQDANAEVLRLTWIHPLKPVDIAYIP